MIDFSKAPDSATHYIDGCDVINSEVSIWKIKEVTLWVNGSDFSWGLCTKWFPISLLTLLTPPKEIPCVKMTKIATTVSFAHSVTCNNEREVMLCEQVLRMCSGEACQYKVLGKWLTHKFTYMLIDGEYRAKHKKELVIPWEWLPDDVTIVEVDESGVHDQGSNPLRIKLDLTEIELPVIVTRPEGK